MKGDSSKLGFATRAIHAGQYPDPSTGAVSVPIYQTSTFVHERVGENKGYDYARGQNPTRQALERNIASLEGGFAGHAFGSGMAAISAIVSQVRTGERVVVSRTVYGGTYRYFTKVLDRTGIEFIWVDTTDLGAVEEALRPGARLLYVETPTNPLIEITDLAACASLAHRYGAQLVVDNTFMSPYFQRPLELGADFVLHSATKYLGGHSDCLAGLTVAKAEADAEWLGFVQKSAGAILGPMDSFLVLRGIKTLGVRMDRHEENARAIARFLADHGKVKSVYYPGLPSHPGHALQKRQATGFGGMIALELGDLRAARAFLDSLQVVSLAESLGGVESLASHPALMTHASVPPEMRREQGISDGLVRISVGIEDLDDLLLDLDRALAAL